MRRTDRRTESERKFDRDARDLAILILVSGALIGLALAAFVPGS